MPKLSKHQNYDGIKNIKLSLLDKSLTKSESDSDSDSDYNHNTNINPGTLPELIYYQLNIEGIQKAYQILLNKTILTDNDLNEIKGLVNQFHQNRGYMDILLFQNIIETMGNYRQVLELLEYNISPGYRTISTKTIKFNHTAIKDTRAKL